MVVFRVSIRERKVAALIMPVRWHFPPNVGRSGKNAVVDAFFIFIDEDEGLARSGQRVLTPGESKRRWEIGEISLRPIKARFPMYLARGVAARAGVAAGPRQTFISGNRGLVGWTDVEGCRCRIAKENTHLNVCSGHVLLSVAEYPRAFHVP